MGHYKFVSTEKRYTDIIQTLNGAKKPVTASEICRIYIGQYTTSDVGSTGQILKILALAGIVKRYATPHPHSKKKELITYELVAK